MEKDKKFNKRLGQKIKECRLEKGLSQPELAKVRDFDSATAISLIENGERSLKIPDLIILSDFFKKDYEYFLGNSTGKSAGRAPKDQDIEQLARRLLRVARNKKK